MKTLGFVFLTMGMVLTPLRGQAQSNTADLLGTVTDQTGAVLPGVDILITSPSRGLTRSTLTSDTGTYRVPLLPPGEYEVRAELAGFTTKVYQNVVLTVGQYANLDISLEVSATPTEVVVSANAAILETEKTVQASTIQEMEIDNLPINGRNYLDFTLLTPGVASKDTLITASAVQTPTSGLSFAGQDQRANYVTIDGADNMDVISNAVRSTLSQDAIQEFQISRNTFSSEFGRARAGMINIVSKSGSNDFHGNGFFFFRNNSLDARNPFAFGPDGSPVDPQFERYQWGGSVGGPIIEDRTFFFANYERLDRNESVFVTFLDDDSIFQARPDQVELFELLGSAGIPLLQNLETLFIDPNVGLLNTTDQNFPGTLDLFRRESGVFPFTADSDTFSLKLDHEFSNNNRMFARFNFGDSFNDGVDFGALQGVSNGVSFDTRDFAAVFSDTHIFSPMTLNDFKFQYGRRRFEVPTNDPVGPEIILSGVAQFGREFFNPTGYTNNVYQFVDNITFIRGDHTLKTGVDINVLGLSGFAEVFLGGQFTFAEAIPLNDVVAGVIGSGGAADLADQFPDLVDCPPTERKDPCLAAPITSVQAFNLGLPITYFQGFGNPNAEFTYLQVGTYFQDAWRVRDNFTLNLGIRYDADRRPPTQNVTSTTAPFSLANEPVGDNNNFAPRVGFAWDPRRNGKTVVRGGYGLYYQNYFQAVAFVSQVLAGQQEGESISQVFLPIFGLPPDFSLTSADIYDFFTRTGTVGEAALDAFGISPGTTPSVILPGDQNVVNPYSHHVSVGIEQELASDLALSVDYLLNRGVHLVRSRDVNVNPVGPNSFTLPGRDPAFVQINMIETSGSSIYHGFTAALRKRFSRQHSFMVSYTLGKAIDDTTDFITQLQPNNQTDLRSERSLSSFDQRHRLVVSGVWQSPRRFDSSQGFLNNLLADWTVAPIVTRSSGRPFNLLVGFDLNGDTHEETDRPGVGDGNIVGRNTGKGPSFFAADLRVSRRFDLPRESTDVEFIFEAFNLLNNVNYSGVNNVVGPLVDSGDVGGSQAIPANRPLGFTSAFDPRQIQFGFRLNF